MPTSSIRTLPGIGPKKSELFAKLGIRTLSDLIRFYPRAYEDRTRICPIAELEIGQPACFIASVVNHPQTSRIPKPGQRQLEVTKVTVADDSARLQLTFFNASYQVQRLIRGETYCFYGSLSGDFLGYGMTNPLFEPLDASGSVTRCIVPIYPQTAGLTSKQIHQAVCSAMARCLPEDVLPEALRRHYGLMDSSAALREIHCPTDGDRLEQARSRLIFEEFFLFSAALLLSRSKHRVDQITPYRTEGMEAFTSALPFSLTNAQKRVIGEILTDFRSGTPMSRLVQGDVGSGKTMVAAAAAFCAAKNGMQTAFMAPTEILAKQHYDNLAPLMGALGLRCALLTGSMTPKQKKLCREEIEAGNMELIIGTHALLTQATVFRSLGLVIADEQHRFGVAQRAALMAKGTHPHLLIMSATPIPRTLALILYGDLDVSVIDELPPGRQKVETFLVNESYRQRLNNFIRTQAENGHQTFIVCPAIEESETESLKAAEQWAQTLRDYVFPTLRVALLHGKMRGAEKEEVMAAFSKGEYDILVSTTVIEVGVDVPNATLMVIENAERFGLSQLHQLRGRIGRGSAKSWCILVSEHREERLKAFCSTTDGFRIAQEDLKQRGPGDFFGSRQHGLPLFRIGNLAQNMELLHQAREAAEVAVSSEALPPATADAIAAMLTAEDVVLN